MTWWYRSWRYLGRPLVILTLVLGVGIALLGIAPPGSSESASAGVMLPDPVGIAQVLGSDVTDSPVGKSSFKPVTVNLPVPSPKTPAANAGASGQPKILEHVVASGETLWFIASQYNTDVDTLVMLNSITQPSWLRVGQRLKVLTAKGLVHKVRAGETLWAISRFYGVPMEQISEANGLTPAAVILVNQNLIIPGASVRPAMAQSRTAQTSRRGGISLFWPVSGRITSWFGQRWGRQHEGLDIGAPYGRTVRAAAGGVVVFAGWNAGYGRLVILDHGNGITTRYGHNSTLRVKPGQWVQRGDALAAVGSTGNSTGAHLHFEVRVNGRAQNPLAWLRE